MKVGDEESCQRNVARSVDAGAIGGDPGSSSRAGIDLDTDAAGPELAGRRDHEAAIATAQIEDDVLCADRGHPQHLDTDLRRRGDEENVGTGKCARKSAQPTRAARAREQQERRSLTR